MKVEFTGVIGATPAKNPPAKERSAFAEAVIKLVKDHKPFHQRNLVPKSDIMEELKAGMDQFLERGLTAHSVSERGSPAFIVAQKMNGSGRLEVDYRQLNSMTEMHSYGIPLINNILQDQVRKTGVQCAGYEAWQPSNEVGGRVAGLHDNVRAYPHLQVARNPDGGQKGQCGPSRPPGRRPEGLPQLYQTIRGQHDRQFRTSNQRRGHAEARQAPTACATALQGEQACCFTQQGQNVGQATQICPAMWSAMLSRGPSTA